MLSKLIKYDLKSLSKFLLPSFVIVLSLALFNRVGYQLSDSITLLKIPYGFITVFYFMSVFLLSFIVCIISGINFYQNLIKDEGYLMNTLPVKKSSLILSKLISFSIAFIISILISSLAIVIGSYNVYFDSKDVDIIINLLKNVDKLFVVILLLLLLISVIMQQLMVYLGITFGQRHNKNKGAMSFVYMIVIYYVTQVFTSICLIVPMQLNNSWTKYLEMDMPPMKILNTFLLISFVLSFIISIVYYILTKYNMERKLNLE